MLLLLPLYQMIYSVRSFIQLLDVCNQFGPLILFSFLLIFFSVVFLISYHIFLILHVLRSFLVWYLLSLTFIPLMLYQIPSVLRLSYRMHPFLLHLPQLKCSVICYSMLLIMTINNSSPIWKWVVYVRFVHMNRNNLVLICQHSLLK